MATSKFKGQSPFRAKGRTTCIHHKDRQLDLYCEICKRPACTKCLSTVHRRHTVCDLNEIIPQKTQGILKFIAKLENVHLVQINQHITSTDTQLKDNVSRFEKLSIELRTQTNKLKGDLDQLTARTLYLYQQMEEDNTKLLQTYKQDLETYSTQLKQQVQECEVALRRGSDIQIYDTVCDIQSSVTLPVKPTLGTASFTPNRNPQGHLKQALGEVNISYQDQGQALLDHDLSFGSAAVQGSSLTQESSENKGRTSSTQQQSKRKVKISPTQRKSTRRKDRTSLLPHTKVLEEWTPSCSISSVCPTTDGQVWTSEDITITLLNRKGEVIQKVDHNAMIRDIRLSPTTNTLWICDRKNNIAKLMSGRLVLRFSTRETPLCISVTASNHVIVGMAKHISKFTTKGTLVLTSSTARIGKPLVCTPYRTSECPITHNVVMTYWDSTHDGGEGKPYVVAMDTDFKKLFVYDGEVPHKRQPTSQSGCAPFNPRGVVYDSVGNLVIGDHNNKSVLLISGRGEFIRIIHTDNFRTIAVGVDRENVLWSVFGLNNVKLKQYNSALHKQQCIIS
ncbi:uncharacterized protein LOC110459385 [Mizuhopecten yessoensis]|uniref:uncharacterized protein LOC110459385 n=1 Tax=Mizuhopecten yessoensis TaxID=6573 RepID=UPI000B45E285|nr:uncharacterized protein LOC110459385 [Mizuhopecten yessoensis]